MAFVYEYQCEGCRRTTLVSEPDALKGVWSGCCGHQWKRRWSFSFTMGMPDHFNTSTGTYVSGDRAFRDTLKAQSDEMSARMGFDVNYQPIDPTPEAVGADPDWDDG